MVPMVLTVDQRSSRSRADLVPGQLGELSALATLRAFERTAGDEIQGIVDAPDVAAAALRLLMRRGEWNIGLGIGPVELPLPAHARAGRGSAYLHAREAVNRAKHVHARICVVGDDVYRADQLETVLWLWNSLLERRSERGWEVAELIGSGLSHAETGVRLGVSQSAVSQRARAANVVEVERAARLAQQLIAELMNAEPR